MKLIDSHRCHGGVWQRYSHESSSCGCEMTFSIFLPPCCLEDDLAEPAVKQDINPGSRLTTVMWLSGLTCNDQNFVQKANAAGVAAANDCILLVPDTSPRGLGIDGEDERYDLGTGAGFYVDATEEPWSNGYRMFSYITEELHQLVIAEFPVDPGRFGIAGHSMGGHGALVLGLRRPDLYGSISAFSPICEPVACDWGQRAFRAYLGQDQKGWQQYDAVALIRTGNTGRASSIRVEQGGADEFLQAGQLRPESLQAACQEASVTLEYHLRAGYDHSYFFIQTWIESHLRYHLGILNGAADSGKLQSGLASN